MRKTCRKCGEKKSASAFFKRSASEDGLFPHCRSCVSAYNKEYRRKHRAACRRRTREWYANNTEKAALSARRYYLKKTFGLTPEDYEAMAAQQQGKCAICGGEPNRKYLSVDHCHDSGEVRGLLCETCNTGLGHFQNDPRLMRTAIGYLARHKGYEYA